MFSAILSHFVLLLKGKHDLDGLPSGRGTVFVLLAISAIAMDSIMNIWVEELPSWFGLFELLIPFGLVALFGYRAASAMLIAIVLTDFVWIILSVAAGYLGFPMPFLMYMIGMSYLVLINLLYWHKRGLIG